MVNLNGGLKLLFVISAIIFLLILVTLPKTDCEACKFEYEGKTIDGYDAYAIFEKACISYAKPWEQPEVLNFSNITVMEGFNQ